MAVRRDKYGRFRGRGGIKPYKSNLSGLKKKQSGKKMSGKRKAVLAVAATATVVAGAYAYKKRSQAVTTSTTKGTKGGMAATNGIKPGASRRNGPNPFAGTIKKTAKQTPKRSAAAKAKSPTLAETRRNLADPNYIWRL